MTKDESVYLVHRVQAAEKARRMMSGVTREQFDRDEVPQLAVVHLVQMIGEAARLVSPSLRSRIREVPWKSITGMRHRVVHDYLHIDLEVVWDTVQTDLQPLIEQLKPHLPPTPPTA